MAMNDTLAAALSKVLNAEKIGKSECTIKVFSSVIKKTLDILNQQGFIGKYEITEDGMKVNLLGRINKCGAIKPRFSLKIGDYEKWEKRFLPAKDFGVLLISTPKGLMIHNEAKDKKMGGKLIAYCY